MINNNLHNNEIEINHLMEIVNNDYVVVIDIRTDTERSFGIIPNSIHKDQNELIDNPFIDKDKDYIIYCSRGKASKELVDKLKDNGHNNYYSLIGGYSSYIVYLIKNKSNKNNDDNKTLDRVEKSIQTKYRTSIMSQFLKAIKNYELIKENDIIAICISGGKDSFLMAMLFKELKKWSKINFDVEYISMDPGYNEINRKLLEENAKMLGIPIKIFNSDIFDIVYDEEKSPCYLCARMRRGHLYSYAKELGCNKIALAHHYDDVIETILMGMLYGGQMQSMLPRLKSTNFEGMELIRPLYLVRENDIINWRDYNDLHFLQCACKFTDTCTSCVNNETKSKRQETKQIIKTLKEKNPYIESNIFRSSENAQVDTLISYKLKGVKHSFLENYE